MRIHAIGFDGDDTLWHNERHYQDTQAWFAGLLRPWADADGLAERLYATEGRNLRLYGYGVKGFTLSLIETALDVTQGQLPALGIQGILERGKEMLGRPVELLTGVRETLEALSEKYALLLVTKGDLFHQEALIAGAGLGDLFRAVEVVSEKDQATYARVLRRHDIPPEAFLMVGNSLRSDVLPVVALGGWAVHIPYAVTWQHEVAEERPGQGSAWWELETMAALPAKLLEIETTRGAAPG